MLQSTKYFNVGYIPNTISESRVKQGLPPLNCFVYRKAQIDKPSYNKHHQTVPIIINNK